MKNTIKSFLAELFCPIGCLSCGEYGRILCDCCRKNMRLAYGKCLGCGKNLFDNICPICNLPFSRQICLGERKAVLRDLVNVYKYESLRSCADELAKMFVDVWSFCQNDVIVPLPTISRHKRERGFGHMEYLAKRIADLSGAEYSALLRRVNNTVQVGASAEVRKRQADAAYEVAGVVDNEKNYYLLDDVWTTGSSMLAAAKKLRLVGAQRVNALLIAKTV